MKTKARPDIIEEQQALLEGAQVRLIRLLCIGFFACGVLGSPAAPFRNLGFDEANTRACKAF